ncbi:MBL fold metallo-hydrolase RNA specificity domain-containing protein [Pelagibaculum spongiae]|uniref:MBL fold metallo-hydrolase n=1 Tax=Pelagibaculum spongiae TaxID=2080658 RepID=A0A2V1H0T1_9GAMM|nr:MBL fold metallo-hydrolase [Pelagibaculum spongiae]PVZ72083.1 MBL fold metallo-hydrolase [Pelagibaculum spongiae]
MKVQFLGAVGTVTGSKYLISHENTRVLLDCGLYQGLKNYRQKNWAPLPVPASSINAVLLSHAHIDHSGYIPALVKQGFTGNILCSRGTSELCKILLPDSGYLQEEDARYANQRNFSRHKPALPLYTEADAHKSLKQFKPLPTHKWFDLGDGLKARFRPSGHILGACMIELNDGHRSLTFSGDLGRPDDLLMRPPEIVEDTDVLIIESTYGDRLHQKNDPFETIAELVKKTVHRGGILLMPAFAVGRAQAVLFILSQLIKQQRIPKIPIYLNSPMAISATEIFHKYHKSHRLDRSDYEAIDHVTRYIRSPEESKHLNQQTFPSVIISASGMASGGRVLHHLKSLLPDHKNTILLLGFQAPGTRGASLQAGAPQIKIHGNYFPVRAEVHCLDSLSAHADQAELLQWMKHFKRPPAQTFICHGESTAADTLRREITDQLGWNVKVPEYLDQADI